jgi:hypothetical protein
MCPSAADRSDERFLPLRCWFGCGGGDVVVWWWCVHGSGRTGFLPAVSSFSRACGHWLNEMHAVSLRQRGIRFAVARSSCHPVLAYSPSPLSAATSLFVAIERFSANWQTPCFDGSLGARKQSKSARFAITTLLPARQEPQPPRPPLPHQCPSAAI